jgi:hypothetical protein
VDRAIFEAFSGLGVFVEEEIAARDGTSRSTGTAGAAIAAGDGDTVMSDDVF